MNKANECTCPSGDGSLVHPCPAHPAVEQACWDERKLSDLGNELHNLSCSIVHENEKLAEQIGGIARELWNWPQACAALAQPSPAQAEAEQPEIVAFRYRCTNAEGEPLPGWFYSDGAGTLGLREPLMAVSQHERIIGAMRAVVTQLRQHKSDYMDAGQETYWALQNEIREREAEIARLDGLVSSRTVERDAAQAEVERLRQGMKGDYDIDAWLEWTKERDTALARVAELERGKVYVEARQCDECQHGGINDSATGVAACHECDWTGPEPEEDRCPGCQRENCMAAACPQCGARYVLVASEEIAAPVAQAQQLNDLDKQCRDDVARALGLRPNQERGFAWSYLLASIKSCVKASGDSAQAQHSVPEVSGIGRDFAYPRSVVLYLRTEPTDDDLRAIHDGLRSLAAAPGKEVPQAWLDVQAERRRQVEAEGWTPEHDDLYCAAELPRAAAAYILNGANDEAPAIWSFSAKWWKPRDARSNYVRAGALILAEIERLDRAAPGKEVGHE
ncbi:hypothetical protein ACP1JC_003657 [Pseudomonas aeruginosa]